MLPVSLSSSSSNSELAAVPTPIQNRPEPTTSYWHPTTPVLDTTKIQEMATPADGSFITGIKEMGQKMGKKLVLTPVTNFPIGKKVQDGTLRAASQLGDPKVAVSGYYPGASFIDPFTRIGGSSSAVPLGAKQANISDTIHLVRLDANEALGVRMPDSSNTIVRGPGTYTFYSPITPLGHTVNIVSGNSQSAPQYFGHRGQGASATDVFTCNVETGRVFVFQIGNEIKILPPGQYAVQQTDATFLKNLMTREHEMHVEVEAKLANNVVIGLKFNVRGSIPDPKTFATEAATFSDLKSAIDDKLSGLILQEVADLQVTEDPTGHPNMNESADNSKAAPALQSKINERMKSSVKNQLGHYLSSIGAELSDIRLVSFAFNNQVQKALDVAASETIETNVRLKNATKKAESDIIEAKAKANAARQAASGEADAQRCLADAQVYELTAMAKAEAEAVTIKADAEHDAIQTLSSADQDIGGPQAALMQAQRERTRQFEAVANGTGKATFVMENPNNNMPAAVSQYMTELA